MLCLLLWNAPYIKADNQPQPAVTSAELPFSLREADLSLGLRDVFLQYDAETLHQIETVAFALGVFL